MISNKHITKIAAILMSIVFVFCIVACLFPNMLSSVIVSDTAYSMEYTDKLFDTSDIIDINIIMDDSEWQKMLDNAMSEVYYKCDVEVNGTTFYSVGIRPKGNTSLSQVANDPNTDRYSFKLEFDQFVDGQTCFGLDKLILNNNYADNTNMKEAIIYDMFAFMGADASLYNYAKISVNDNYWGVYLALEAVEDSFMLRNYGGENGKLYKPDSMNFGGRDDNKGGNSKGGDFPGGGKMPDMGDFAPQNMPTPADGFPMSDEQTTPSEDTKQQTELQEKAKQRSNSRGGFPGGGGGPGMGGSGTNLNYTDDNLDSYSAIWESSVNGSRDADHRRVVTALKNVSEKTNAEKYLDVDNLLKYMVVHNFSVNEDSLSGGMAHNYYLYEANGKLNIIPWDYNLCWGGMGGMGNRNGSGATGTINEPIDDSYSSTQFFDIFLNDEEYLSMYHSYYNELIEGYVNSGRFEETYNRIRGQIDELVKNDPNAMCSYEEYIIAADMIYDVIMLRAESISGQLDGSIPTTSEEQNNTPDALVDASSVDLSAMGGMGGGGRGGFDREKREQNTPTAETDTEINTESGDNNG